MDWDQLDGSSSQCYVVKDTLPVPSAGSLAEAVICEICQEPLST